MSSSSSTVVSDSEHVTRIPNEDAGSASTASADDTDEKVIAPILDIEHKVVDDDPRLWSRTRKSMILA